MSAIADIVGDPSNRLPAPISLRANFNFDKGGYHWTTGLSFPFCREPVVKVRASISERAAPVVEAGVEVSKLDVDRICFSRRCEANPWRLRTKLPCFVRSGKLSKRSTYAAHHNRASLGPGLARSEMR
jgi:hypothetical protein